MRTKVLFAGLIVMLLVSVFGNRVFSQDYLINRGVFAASYTGGLRMCVVDKNEYYQPYNSSSHCAVRQYKNGIVSQYGTTTAMPPMAGGYDIAYDSAGKVMYVAFFSSDYDSIYAFKRSSTDPDWVLAAGILKPTANLLGYTLRLSFNKAGSKLFLAFNEQTTLKVYLYELNAGSWTNRTGASTMACYNSWFDLISYGNKVIVTTTPLVVNKYTLRVHVYDITTTIITNLPDWNNGLNFTMVHFATTAYNVYTNEYVAFFSSNYTPVALMSAAGGAWTNISTGLSGTVDNGSWGCYLVFNNLMSRYTAFFSGSTLKGYSWNGTSWVSLGLPTLSSTNTYAVSNYKDAYFLAWSSNTQVGIFTPNETPWRNTMNIATTPGTTTCDLLFPARGVGHKVVVFVKQGTYVAPVTADNTTYTANTAFGSGTQLGSSGWYCVYNGVGQALTITGLTQGTTYQVQALEYNGLAGAEMYMGSASVTGNPVSFTTAGVSCVNPTNGGTIASGQSICTGAVPVPFTSTALPSGHSGTLEYKWQISTTSSTAGFTDIPSSNSPAYSPGATSVNTWFKRVARVDCKTDWTGAAESNVLAITVTPAPTPSITGPATPCVGTTGNTYTTQTGMTGYTWTVSAGGTITSGLGTSQIQVTWASAGAKTVTVNYTNSGGCSAASPAVYNVTVGALPSAANPISGSGTVCAGSTGISYTTTAITGATTYNWTVPVGSTITSGANTTSIVVSYGASAVSGYVVVWGSGPCGGGSPSQLPVTVNAAPVPTISGPASVCAGVTGKVYTTEPGMTGYAWAITGGTITGGAGTNSVTVTWTTAGAQTISVNYNNAAGCPAINATTYNVSVNALPTPTITGAATICQGLTTTYTTQTGQASYVWTVSAGGQIMSGQGTAAVNVKWNTAGAQAVAVNYANSNGCTAASPTSYPVTVNTAPVPTITGTTVLCATSGYYDYTTETGQTNYIWTVSSGGSIISGQGTYKLTVYWGTAGAQTVSVNYNNASGCSATTPTVLNITVNNTPPGAPGAISGPSTVCAGQQGVGYSVAPVSGAVAYAWTLPAGAAIASGANTNSITVNFAANASSGSITVSANNLCGSGPSSPALNITVSGLPAAAGAITGSAQVCANSQGVAYSVAAITNATGYTWSLPTGATIATGANTNSITVNFGTTGGTITVFGTNSCGVGTASPNYSVTVNPKPATPTITQNGYVLTSSAADGNQWYKDGTTVTGATAQTYTVPASALGYYWVKVTLLGCTSDESNHIYIQGVGIGETSMGSFNIFPIPNDGKFTAQISWPVAAKFSISVYNELGQKVYIKNDIQVDGTTEQSIDFRPAPAGVYTVVFSSADNKVIRKIMIKD